MSQFIINFVDFIREEKQRRLSQSLERSKLILRQHLEDAFKKIDPLKEPFKAAYYTDNEKEKERIKNIVFDNFIWYINGAILYIEKRSDKLAYYYNNWVKQQLKKNNLNLQIVLDYHLFMPSNYLFQEITEYSQKSREYLFVFPYGRVDETNYANFLDILWQQYFYTPFIPLDKQKKESDQAFLAYEFQREQQELQQRAKKRYNKPDLIIRPFKKPHN